MKKGLLLLLLVWFLADNPTVVLAATTGLSLSPATQTLKVADTLVVNLLVNTGGQNASSINAVVSYDPSKLQVVDADSTTLGTQIQPGTLISASPTTNVVDATNGTITYATGTLTPSYNGQGTLATITFKTLAPGLTQPAIVLTGSAITDSTSNNLLTGGSVQGGSYTITGSSASTTTSVITTASSSGGTLPSSGAGDSTLFIFGIGALFILVSLGISKSWR